MKNEIKETCSCGATLEFKEDIGKAWEGQMSYRQGEFHRAHEKCRKYTLIDKEESIIN